MAVSPVRYGRGHGIQDEVESAGEKITALEKEDKRASSPAYLVNILPRNMSFDEVTSKANAVLKDLSSGEAVAVGGHDTYHEQTRNQVQYLARLSGQIRGF